MQDIQKVVFDIIKTSRDIGLGYIEVPLIKEETKKTSLSILDDEFVNTKRNLARKVKKTKLDFAIMQALRELKKKQLIRQTKKGHWTVVKGAEKYRPVICKALKKQYEIYCPKCKKYTYVIKDDKKVLKKRCPDCNKKVEINFYKYHCPVRNVFIGDPKRQCELLHGTDVNKLSKEVFPMRICYFKTKPTKPELEYAQRKIEKEEEKQLHEIRYYNSNIRDPLSKHYLPKFAKED